MLTAKTLTIYIVWSGFWGILCGVTSAFAVNGPDVQAGKQHQENVYSINGVAVPTDFPVFRPNIMTDGCGSGRIFLANYTGTPYIMILENDGTPYYYQRIEEKSQDFKVQPNGLLTRRVRGDLNAFIGYDSTFAVVDTFQCVNGFRTDPHELCMTEDGGYYLVALGYRRVDMSRIVTGGQKNAQLVDNHIQGFDRDHNLVFQWLCTDYFNVRDAVFENLRQNTIDYVHINSIAVDYDGHLVISSRHLCEVTKINRQTGELLWRLGGENNQFTFVNDPHGLNYQHDARPVPGKPGHYTVFDNGNFRIPSFSRAVEFKLDTLEKTATKVWEYRSTPEFFTNWMGNVQRLPNGNTLINWADASLPKMTEVTPSGRVVYQGDFVFKSPCYRTFRFDKNIDIDRPCLYTEALPDKVRLVFNKFGDRSVKEYVLYGGIKPDRLYEMYRTRETFYHLTTLQDNKTYYFAVAAVDSNGQKSELSAVKPVRVRYAAPDENFIREGDFDGETDSWELKTRGGASAIGINAGGEYLVKIIHGGSSLNAVQLIQEDIPVIRDMEYRLSFEAFADANRAIEPKIQQNGDPWINYSRSGPVMISRKKRHYQIDFKMIYNTDYRARLLFNLGGYDHNVVLDNIRLSFVFPTHVEDKIVMPSNVHLFQNYPNPFNSHTSVRYTIGEEAHVKLTLYNMLGRVQEVLVEGGQGPGGKVVKYDAEHLSSGIYYYTLDVKFKNGRSRRLTRKMLLVK